MTELPAPDAATTWTPPHPTAVALTLARMRRGRPDPTHRTLAPPGPVEPDVAPLWRTTLTDDGPATMLLTQADLHTVTCRAWGPGARAAVDAAPALCGAEDDPTGFRPAHPLLDELHRRHPGLRVPRSRRVLEALIPAVVEQRVVGVDATAGWRRLVHAFGTPAPGPAPAGMRVVPTPAAWAAIPTWEWHRAGIDPGRARTVVACARLARRLESVAALDPAEADARLRAVPGVGAWTAAEVAQRALGDADALSLGDHHLAGVVGHVLFGRDLDDAGLVTALAPWRPHRYRVVRLLQAAGHETRPRRGPRPPGAAHRRR